VCSLEVPWKVKYEKVNAICPMLSPSVSEPLPQGVDREENLGDD